ncbi:MAG: ATP-binding protein, partial [Smithella sp.]
EGGKITVTVKNDEYYITVSIADNGTGIPPEKLPLIFEPFYRCAEKNEKHSGSGLGLTFCKKIMESHNGVIDVSSGEGEGSIFVLTFPVSINTERNASGEIQ